MGSSQPAELRLAAQGTFSVHREGISLEELPGSEGAVSALPLVGRGRELAMIEERLAPAADRGGALLVRGPAGVGKSAFLQATLCYAADRGLLTLTTDGSPAEAQLPFASLHRLLRPLLGDLGRLPAPQRQAIQAAFGLDDTAAADFFLIALASLELL